jgi:predicted  nucleic acid-binding Zn-ribbon protein
VRHCFAALDRHVDALETDLDKSNHEIERAKRVNDFNSVARQAQDNAMEACKAQYQREQNALNEKLQQAKKEIDSLESQY